MEKELQENSQILRLEQLKERFRLSEEAIALIQEDWAAGLTPEQTDEYTDPKLSLWQMKMISKCLHKHVDSSVISLIKQKKYEKDYLETVLQIYDGDVPKMQVETWIQRTGNVNMLMQYYERYKEKMQMDEQQAIIEDELKREQEADHSMEKSFLQLSETVQKLLDGQQKVQDLQKHFEEQAEELSRLRKEKEKLEGALSKCNEEKMKEKYDRERCEASLAQKRTEVEELKRKLRQTKESKPVKEEKTEEMKPKVEVVYHTAMTDNSGHVIASLPVERNTRNVARRTGVLAAFAFRKKSRRDIVRLVTERQLSQGQLEQIRVAIEKGLKEEQLIHIIHSGLSPEQMKELVEIAVSLNQCGYTG